MKRISSILFFFGLSFCLYGQQKIRQDSVVLSFSLVDKDRSISPKLNSISTTNMRFNDLFQIRDLLTEGANLKLHYSLIDLEKDFSYYIRGFLIDQNRDTIFPNPYRIEGNMGLINFTNREGYRLNWDDFLEEVGEFGDTYDFVIDLTLFGEGIECGFAPTIPLKDHLYYLSTGAVGAGLIALGGHFYKKANAANDHYYTIWEAGASKSDSQLPRRNFENNKNANKLLNYLGLGILVADGFLYTLRLLKHHHKIRKYKKYCGPKKNGPLQMELIGLPSDTFVPGFRLSKKF